MEELKEVFGGDKITTEDWKEIIREVDENEDGEVKYFIHKVLPRFAFRSSLRSLKK